MKSTINTSPKPTKMTFGVKSQSGKDEHNGKETQVIIRHQPGIIIPAGNPKNEY